MNSGGAARQISTTFTDTEVNNCFSIYHTSWIASGPKSNFICENIATKAICFASAAQRWIVLGQPIFSCFNFTLTASVVCIIISSYSLQFKYMNLHIVACVLQLLRVYYEPTTWPAPSWLDSSVGRALHRYRRGHGFESRSGLNFVQALISQLLKLCA